MSKEKKDVLVKSNEYERAIEVRTKIDALRVNMFDGLLDIAELLAEARRGDYHIHYGFPRFGDWVEQGSGLDMSERTAYYLIKIVENAKLLGISREELRAAKLSKLKEIFSLDAEVHGDEIKLLVGEAKESSLDDIRTKVQKIKSGGGEEPFVFLTIKVPMSVKENYIDPAFELIRRQYGDRKDAAGNPVDITSGVCMEYLCQAFVQDQNNYGELLKESSDDSDSV